MRGVFALQQCKGMGIFLYSCAVFVCCGGKFCCDDILKEGAMYEAKDFGFGSGGLDGWVWIE